MSFRLPCFLLINCWYIKTTIMFSRYNTVIKTNEFLLKRIHWKCTEQSLFRSNIFNSSQHETLLITAHMKKVIWKLLNTAFNYISNGFCSKNCCRNYQIFASNKYKLILCNNCRVIVFKTRVHIYVYTRMYVCVWTRILGLLCTQKCL